MSVLVICEGPLSTLTKLWQAHDPLSDRRGQAEALYYFGWVYSELGEVQKASDFHNRALSLWSQPR